MNAPYARPAVTTALPGSAITPQQARRMEILGTRVAAIAHEFNNILCTILSYGELARQSASDGSPVRLYLDNIMRAAERAGSIADDILAYSRNGIPERTAVAIQSCVAEALELLEVTLAETVHLKKDLAAPEARVIGHEIRFHRMAMNLCANAVQAMPRGGELHVRLEQLRVATPRKVTRGRLVAGSYVRLSVSDTGCGIAPDLLKRIFDAFFTTKPLGQGIGLGLSLVDGMVAALGGAIEVSSVLGAGTTFSVWLPASGDWPTTDGSG